MVETQFVDCITKTKNTSQQRLVFPNISSFFFEINGDESQE
ncbi:hypothetical protein [Clostridioides difficile]|nr:hypothetical protein [Clostridioides difficile]